MKSPDLTALVQLIGDRMGLKISSQQLASLQRYVEARLKALRLSNVDDYCVLLRRVSAEQKTWQGGAEVQEWKQLISQLTVGESYFFRDTKQFELLKTRIFPELIQRKRQDAIAISPLSPNPRPSLRLWSAGCSTGEEVYSLAIVLQELIPDWNRWNIQVIGTDVNAISIEKAETGLYPDWSFRHTQPEVRPQYLLRTPKGWQVSQALKQMVRFYPLNLVSDGVPNPQFDLNNIDFIICRNVFIYFHPDAIVHVLRKFHAVLNPLGYLMTGHTELQGISIQPFQICCFPESILYQRSLSETAYSESLTKHQLPINASANGSDYSASKSKYHQVKQPLAWANSSSISGRNFNQVPDPARRDTALNPVGFQSQDNKFSTFNELNGTAYQARLKAAEAYANSGHHAEAVLACQQALQLQPFQVEPLYLLAHLAEENNDADQAKLLLKKIIYLDPNAVAAYLELAMIYRRQGDLKRATKHLHHAFLLLSTMPETAQMPGYSYATVGDARQYLQQLGIAAH